MNSKQSVNSGLPNSVRSQEDLEFEGGIWSEGGESMEYLDLN